MFPLENQPSLCSFKSPLCPVNYKAQLTEGGVIYLAFIECIVAWHRFISSAVRLILYPNRITCKKDYYKMPQLLTTVFSLQRHISRVRFHLARVGKKCRGCHM
jgi:hypothetical protein